MLNGHLDTMPAGPGWTTDPLEPVVRDGHLFGLGAADQKSGLAAMAVAATAVRRASCPSGDACCSRALSTRRVPGWARGDWSSRASTPTAPSSPNRPNSGWFESSNGQVNLELLVRGKSAHGSTPESGKNAIDAAARVIVALGEQAAACERGSTR